MTISELRQRLGRRDALGAIAALAGGSAASACNTDRGRAMPSREPTPIADPLRVIEAVPAMDGAGARVKRLFPHGGRGYLDPFVLLDDFRVGPPAGFPTHPHRGFEAFTYMLDGSFHHKDSMGNDSVVTSGGTQRFTSGRGAKHSEMPAEARENRGLQLWINLPRKLKQIEPEYEAVHALDIPEVHQAGVTVRTIVGETSPVKLRTPVRYLDLSMERRATWEEEMPAGHQGLIYVASGHIRLGDRDLTPGQAALPKPGPLALIAQADARIFYIAGQSHNEPIRHRGPFVD